MTAGYRRWSERSSVSSVRTMSPATSSLRSTSISSAIGAPRPWPGSSSTTGMTCCRWPRCWDGSLVPSDDADLAAGELAGVGRLWERCDPGRAAVYYERALSAGLAGDEGHRVRLRLARWQKRQARWNEACALWQEASAARVFDVTPWEELAKYHEHRRRDFGTALGIVQDALALAQASKAPVRALDALVYRLSRLERRTRRAVTAPA